MFILSSISIGSEFWSVNHTSIYQSSEWNVFKYKKYLDEISNKSPNDVLGTNLILFFILYTYILIEGLPVFFSSCFF